MDGSIIIYGQGYWGAIHTAPQKLGDTGVISRQNDRAKVEYRLTNAGHYIEISEMSVTLNDGRLVEIRPSNAVVKVANGNGLEIVQDKKKISDTIRDAIEYVRGLGYISGLVNSLPGGLNQNGHNGVKGTYLPPEIKPNGDGKVKITYLLEEMLRVHSGVPQKPTMPFSLRDLIW